MTEFERLQERAEGMGLRADVHYGRILIEKINADSKQLIGDVFRYEADHALLDWWEQREDKLTGQPKPRSPRRGSGRGGI